MSEVIAFISNSLTISVFVGYLFALWAALVGWAWFDINSRTDNTWFKLGTVLIVATGGIFGFAIYLLLRPSLTRDEIQMREIEETVLSSQSQFFTCPECHYTIRDDFAYCPNCALKLHSICSGCEREISISWSACPYCGQKKEKKVEEVVGATEVLTPVEVVSNEKSRNVMLFSALSNWFKKRTKKSTRKAKAVSELKEATKNKVRKPRKKKS